MGSKRFVYRGTIHFGKKSDDEKNEFKNSHAFDAITEWLKAKLEEDGFDFSKAWMDENEKNGNVWGDMGAEKENPHHGNCFKTCKDCIFNLGEKGGKVLCKDDEAWIWVPDSCAVKKLGLIGWMKLEREAIDKGQFILAKSYRESIMNLAKQKTIPL